ncbi:helix-turn-helix transcriptional regulator [Sphingomonas sp.]|uniref:helix-turn-helix transcriptional regulator n=1 Tax=Sphingomonas sp. TaxID=28214 RepID=UPI0028A9606D|nr:helix-turn-helix transcriptional regulator [Sphingomonas sp.]
MTANKPLADFLRSRRHRLDPAAMGVSSARRRRTPGLRREEVAERAGISCEWYVKLEQGREVSASSETIAALARALMLDDNETAHLRRLAVAQAAPYFLRETVPEIVQTIVRSLNEPAYVTGARMDVLCWNVPADELFGFSGMAEAERNILRWMMASSAARALFGEGWMKEAQRIIAMFRATYDQYWGDPLFEEIVSALQAASAEFRDWWSSYRVATPSSGMKMLRPAGGEETPFVYATFQVNDDPALKLALYTRAG